MDCNNILLDLSEFDTRAPISVSILFEDSDEVEDINTENIVTDQNTEHIIQLPDITSKLKTERKSEPISTPEISDDVKVNNKEAEKNIYKELEIYLSQCIDNKPISDESRKRKEIQLQTPKNKKKPCLSSTDASNENKLNNQSSHVLKNASKSELTNSACDGPRAEITYSACDDLRAETSCKAKSNPDLPPGADSVKDSTNAPLNKLSTDIKRCLLLVSEHMRLIMQAYYQHKHFNTPVANFVGLKRQLFNLSYSTVVTMLLPEEKNIDFLRTFLTETYRHACETPSVHKNNYKDYVVLLRELLKWTKDNKTVIDTAGYLPVNNTVLQTNNHNINHTELNKPIEHNALTNNIEHELRKSQKSADQDKICIFSAGSRGNEISINVDPNFKKCVSNICSSNSLEATHLEAPIERRHSQITHKMNALIETELAKQLARPPQNYSKNHNHEQFAERPVIAQSGNIPDSTNFQHAFTRQINTSHQMQAGGLPQIQRPSRVQQVQTPLQRSQKMPQQYGQYGHISETLPQYRQPTNFSSQCGATQHVQSSQLQPQSWQWQVGQQQSKQSSPAIQAPVWHVPHVLPQYGQQQRHNGHNPPPYDQINHTQRQLQQQHLLPQMQSQKVSPQTHPQYGASNNIPAQYGQTQSGLPRYGQVPGGQPPNGQSHGQTQLVKAQSENLLPTECHQQPNMLQHQTRTQVRGSPRSVSTDSGFISPLNFVPADQTIPPSENTETANLLITHVTSLNPKVSYIDEGKCVVCKKPTKQVCMGCMLRYYCSYECQLADWSNHEPICTVSK